MHTKIINIWGVPGAGKTTLAAELYVELKKQNKSVDFVTEVAKDYVYRGQRLSKSDQISVATKQLYYETLKYGKIDYLITDCPAFLPYFYLEVNHNTYFTYDFLMFYDHILTHQNVQTYDFLIERDFNYNNEGRFETEEESIQLYSRLRKFLDVTIEAEYDIFKTSNAKTSIMEFINEQEKSKEKR